MEGARNTAVDESDRGITDSHKLFPLFSLPSSSGLLYTRVHEARVIGREVAFTNFQERNVFFFLLKKNFRISILFFFKKKIAVDDYYIKIRFSFLLFQQEIKIDCFEKLY